MKWIVQVMILSFFIQLAYQTGSFAIRYVQAWLYVPDVLAGMENVIYLQNEVFIGGDWRSIFIPFWPAYALTTIVMAVLLFIRKNELHRKECCLCS